MSYLPELPPAPKALVLLLVAFVLVEVRVWVVQASIITATSSTNAKISIFGLRAPVAIDAAAFRT